MTAAKHLDFAEMREKRPSRGLHLHDGGGATTEVPNNVLGKNAGGLNLNPATWMRLDRLGCLPDGIVRLVCQYKARVLPLSIERLPSRGEPGSRPESDPGSTAGATG